MEDRMKRPSGIGEWLRLVLPWALLLVLLLLPAAGLSFNLMRLLFLTAVWTTTSLGWNLLGGMTGQVSFGFAVFFGLGAYTTALLMQYGHNPYFSFIGGAAIAMLASFFIGLPTFRLRGPYFVIATIGVTEPVPVIRKNLALTAGALLHGDCGCGPNCSCFHHHRQQQVRSSLARHQAGPGCRCRPGSESLHLQALDTRYCRRAHRDRWWNLCATRSLLLPRRCLCLSDRHLHPAYAGHRRHWHCMGAGAGRNHFCHRGRTDLGKFP